MVWCLSSAGATEQVSPLHWSGLAHQELLHSTEGEEFE